MVRPPTPSGQTNAKCARSQAQLVVERGMERAVEMERVRGRGVWQGPPSCPCPSCWPCAPACTELCLSGQAVRGPAGQAQQWQPAHHHCLHHCPGMLACLWSHPACQVCEKFATYASMAAAARCRPVARHNLWLGITSAGQDAPTSLLNTLKQSRQAAPGLCLIYRTSEAALQENKMGVGQQ